MELMEGWRRHKAIRRRQRVPRRFRDRTDPLAYDDDELFRMYRFRRGTVLSLIILLSPAVERQTDRNNPISAALAVCMALRFYATNAFFHLIGDIYGVEEEVAGGAVHAVSQALRDVAHKFIKFGDVEETKAGFKRVNGFKNVLGCVDGTFVRIQRPAGIHEVDYVCRKWYHALNVQAVCDHWFRIVNIVAKWPGSANDKRIFAKCKLRRKLQNDVMSGFLLGDGGYKGERFLLTPYGKALTPSEQRFNDALCGTRVLIEQTFGVWKRRFPCVGTRLRLEPDKAVTVVIAVAVLHNIGIERGDIIPDDYEPLLPSDEEEDDPIPPAPDGAAMREAVRIQDYS